MKALEAFANERPKRHGATTRKLLITANSVVLLLDVIQNVLPCLKVYISRYMCFPLICAIKLEVEFFILNRLVKCAEEASESLHVAEFSSEGFVSTVKNDDTGL
jgi:hypothetical protein